MQVFDFASYARFKWSDMRMIFKAMGVTLHVTLVSLAIGTLIIEDIAAIYKAAR